MSYTHIQAIATCTVKCLTDTSDIAHDLYDYFTDNENEIPMCFYYESFEEFADIIESYVSLQDDKLTIQLDTENTNQDQEIFDFIIGYYAKRMTNKFMQVMWMSYDTRDGMNAFCNYYDNNDNLINVEKLLNTI